MPEKAFSKIGNIAIYVYWSRNKTLEANTLSYVQELINVSELVLFVSNSKIDSKDVTKLTNLGATFLQRDNTGFFRPQPTKGHRESRPEKRSACDIAAAREKDPQSIAR
jgi:hypothetical protein